MTSDGAGTMVSVGSRFSGFGGYGYELGQTDDPRDLVAGDPEAVSRTIDGLATVGDAVDRTADGLLRIDTASIWSGPASDAFREYFRGKPQLWAELAEALSGAAGALVPYRDTLRWAQAEAAAAIAEYRHGEQVTEAAERDFQAAVEAYEQAGVTVAGVAPAPPVFHDPGEGVRAAARERLDRARGRLAEQASETAGHVDAHRNALPDRPGLIKRLAFDAIDEGKFQLTQGADVVAGAREAVTDLATFIAAVNPARAYNLTHPADYLQNLHTFAQGVQHGVTHPVELGKAITQWDTWKDSPGRAGGNLLPDLLASLLSGGAGAASRIGSTAGRLGRSAMPDTGAIARHADDTIPAGRPDGARPGSQHTDGSMPDFGPRSSDPHPAELGPDPSVEPRNGPPERPAEEPYPDHDDPYNPPELDQPHSPAEIAPTTGHRDPNWDYDDPFDPADLDAEPLDRQHPSPEPSQREDMQPRTGGEPPRDSPQSQTDYIDNPSYKAGPDVHETYHDQFGSITDQQRRMLDHWRQEHYQQLSHLDDSELLALDRYPSNHTDINRALREHDLDALHEFEPQVRELVSGLNKLPIYEGAVYRGINIDPEHLSSFLDAYRTGDFIREPGFLSADMAMPYQGNVQFVIDSVNGVHVPRLSDSMFGLHEVMWTPGNLFQVRGITVDEATNTVMIRLSDLPRG